ncbi:MAG TPA: glycoside hydrolase family 3 N-terminal domain-containing protein [Pyrinomonadaceae bacterium]|jgi:beta-N-acetylhexosaminidase|nr:glycoside hydrolase family 3 N-terminal domain-containing protein [Pyrinomonadaceae bacterium]
MPSPELPDIEEESLERRAGRLLFVGLPVTKLDRHWRELLREVRPGGVILFGRNIESAEQVALLNAQIRDAAGSQVFIGVDQEGGLVDRFRDICEPAPSAKAVRDAGIAELADRFGSLTARALRLLGFNMNFAPVLDLSGDNEENGLRARTFGAGPEMVSLLAGAYLEGLQRGQVIAVGKHFPGLGGAKVDSHRRLPVITKTWEEIFERDLVPFMDLMFHRPGERLRAVMVSHAAFPDVSEFLQAWFRRSGDPPTIQGLHEFPATISGNVTTRLLRRILKFDGLVITDDMEMGAVVQTLSVAEASLRAIEAGSDMVLICEQEANFVAARDEIVKAVREQRLSVRVPGAARRRMSRALKLTGEPEQFDAEEFRNVSRQIAQLKLNLKAAEETGEYAPVYGTDGGGVRRSSNF